MMNGNKRNKSETPQQTLDGDKKEPLKNFKKCNRILVRVAIAVVVNAVFY